MVSRVYVEKKPGFDVEAQQLAHELRTIEQRFQLLYLLTCGNSYSEIEAETGASSATISRASRQLNNSHCGIAGIIARSAK